MYESTIMDLTNSAYCLTSFSANPRSELIRSDRLPARAYCNSILYIIFPFSTVKSTLKQLMMLSQSDKWRRTSRLWSWNLEPSDEVAKYFQSFSVSSNRTHTSKFSSLRDAHGKKSSKHGHYIYNKYSLGNKEYSLGNKEFSLENKSNVQIRK